jgi:hypothetical protein
MLTKYIYNRFNALHYLPIFLCRGTQPYWIGLYLRKAIWAVVMCNFCIFLELVSEMPRGRLMGPEWTAQ